MGALESALYRPQTGYYLDIIEEAAALFRLKGYQFSVPGDDIYSKIIEFFDSGQFRSDVLETWMREIVTPQTP